MKPFKEIPIKKWRRLDRLWLWVLPNYYFLDGDTMLRVKRFKGRSYVMEIKTRKSK